MREAVSRRRRGSAEGCRQGESCAGNGGGGCTEGCRQGGAGRGESCTGNSVEGSAAEGCRQGGVQKGAGAMQALTGRGVLKEYWKWKYGCGARRKELLTGWRLGEERSPEGALRVFKNGWVITVVQ